MVGDGLPEVFALGAAIGTPDSFIIALAILLSGSLTATVSSPPLVASGTIFLFFKTTVIGPGQYFFASE